MSQSEKRFSNKVGEEYDLFSLALPHHDEIQIKTVEILSKHFPIKVKRIEVLEIGFGTGITSKELLSKDIRVHLVAIDNEPVMLSKAQDKLRTFSKDRFTLHTIDALEYLKQQEDNSVDAVISVWVLHNLQNDFRSLILKEISRVLKPKGIFVNGDKLAVSDELKHKKNLEWQLRQFDLYEKINRPELKKAWTEHYVQDENPNRLLYEKNIIQDLSNLGFVDCKVSNRHHMDAIISATKE